MNLRRRLVVAVSLSILVIMTASSPALGQHRFARGNANGDNGVDIADAIFSLGCQFLGSRCPVCLDAADANDDGQFDLGDAIYSLSWQFRGGPAPPAPGPFECGVDPTDDDLDCAGDSALCPAPPLTGGEVHGFVVARLAGGRVHRLPGARVSLLDLATSTQGPQVTTDCHGWYTLAKHPAGNYRVCAEADGYVSSCEPAVIPLLSENFSTPQDARLTPSGGVIIGQVRLADDSVAYREHGFFGIRAGAEVALFDAGGQTIAGPVSANSLGEYALPGIPAPGAYRLEATFLGGESTRAVNLSASDLLGETPFDLVVANRQPVVESVLATLAGAVVRTASPGDTLEVEAIATDPDGDTLEYRWTDGNGRSIDLDSPIIDWTLVDTEARNLLYVLVSDGRGGFATGQLAIPTGPAVAHFSGRVSEFGVSPPIRVAGARVTVDEESTVTDEQGFFALTAPIAKRHILSVRKPGFVILSRVFHGSVTDLELELDQPQRTVVPPGQGEVLLEDARGTTVRINVAQLVDATGRAPTVPVNLDLHTFDLDRPNALPGDYSALNAAGENVTMESFGCMSLDISDDAGNTYDLAPGTTAQISIRVDEERLPFAPPLIPLFRFDEDTGVWHEEAQATLVGDHYEGSVPSFSIWNIDVYNTNSSCIRVNVDLAKSSFPFTVRVTTPTGTGNQINTFVATEEINVIYRVPPNTIIKIELLPASGPVTVLKTYNVNSGPMVNQILYPDQFPPYPYTGCNASVTVSLDLPAHTAQWLSRKGFGSAADAAAYYTAIGAIPAKDTLTKFKLVNGFGGAGEIVACYYNAGDLGFGRQMHGVQTGGNVACYVTNFGSPGGPPAPAIADCISSTSPVATVAMEYSPAPSTGTTKVVKFYVYDGAGNISNAAVLDTEGPKFTPNICFDCHGGTYGSPTNPDKGSSFREFDVFTFLYSTIPAYTLTGQQEALRKLNNMVMATNPNPLNANQGINNLITDMYSGTPALIGTTAVDTHLPPLWVSKPALYQTINRVYCRTCHIAQPSYIDFTAFSQFTTFSGSIKYAACTSRDMPHAEVPFKKFWFSANPHAPLYLADPGTGLGFGGTCPP